MTSWKKPVTLSTWICICLFIFHQARLLTYMSTDKQSGLLENGKAKDIPLARNEETNIPAKMNSFECKAFDPENPKLVLLLSYQRAGSTFTGQLFNLNEDVFYSFEPLDAAYTRLFGTEENWAVPIDIHFHWNGSYRHMLPQESTLMRQTIDQIFNCHYDHIVGEHLLHRFWLIPNVQRAVKPFVECLVTNRVGLSKCTGLLHDICPKRIGENIEKQERCNEELNLVYNGSQSSINEFNIYKECTELQLKDIQEFCLPKLIEICSSKRIRAIKTVRLEMETIEELIEKYPNLRIIHLLRDPRPVVLSRLKTEWAISGGTNSEIITQIFKNPRDFKLKANSQDVIEIFKREAELYCYLAVKDIRDMIEIEKQNPGKTMRVIYERFLFNQQEEVNTIYHFLGEKIPGHISAWINKTKLPHGVKYGNEKIATKWKSQMTGEMINAVDSACQNLYKEVAFVWQKLE